MVNVNGRADRGAGLERTSRDSFSHAACVGSKERQGIAQLI